MIFTKNTTGTSALNVWFFDWRHYVSCKIGSEFWHSQ